ncbi:MAG TPA: hypothetical protein V6D20_25300 [Candidatus Obscuribacterales bacterium]
MRVIPSNFEKDWNGWAANQSGHIALGMFFAAVACMAYLAVFGEFPVRGPVWFSILVAYLYFETSHQRWQGADTIEDTVFVAGYGAGGVLYTFKEVNIGTGDIIGNLWSAMPFLILASIHFIVGIWIRYRNEQAD